MRFDLRVFMQNASIRPLHLSSEPKAPPQMKLNPGVRNIHDFKFEDFELVGCDPHPAINYLLAVWTGGHTQFEDLVIKEKS